MYCKANNNNNNNNNNSFIYGKVYYDCTPKKEPRDKAGLQEDNSSVYIVLLSNHLP